MVLDEAQAIKNPATRRFFESKRLKTAARFCLTGTPVENNLLDIWSLMDFLNPGLLGEQKDFLSRYNQITPHLLPHLQRLLAPLILRRSRNDVLQQLPPLSEITFLLDFNRKEKEIYEKQKQDTLSTMTPTSPRNALLAGLMRLRRACCHPRLVASYPPRLKATKLEALLRLLHTLRLSGHRALVFSQFTDMLDIVGKQLCRDEVPFCRLDGSMSANQRNRALTKFHENQADFFLISLLTGGTGLNLTEADYVILLDPWWNSAVEEQAISRSHRHGQIHPVTVCRFIMRGSIEERILALQKR